MGTNVAYVVSYEKKRLEGCGYALPVSINVVSYEKRLDGCKYAQTVSTNGPHVVNSDSKTERMQIRTPCEHQRAKYGQQPKQDSRDAKAHLLWASTRQMCLATKKD
jgi:hypothetical protein